MIPLQWYLYLALALFAVGLFGFVSRRNVIIVLLCVELMLNAVNIALTALGTALEDVTGHIVVFFVIAVAAAEAAIGLSLVVLIYKRFREVHLDEVKMLKG
ncbi:MAG TPA: NADH-quinone oxidoreductase subunit NuoK [Thermosulfurimonas dismutans]|uniref:NADH-quinone oxidoreductase subunit K n=1 Tax=Thermosulfurimonas dismutans TaxID=999894 RepID=A0A7C3CLG8_9BACT|nr:NADH-quinone oxidoreductase subunit NuoK [Thermosulfurimonas sp.]HFC98711.1 NADH-quinone oxidoreductase subunit NuoK [Thermosulfurimonas dismutans]